MPYDPRMLQQMGRMGLGMMNPQPAPFQQPQQQQPQRPPEWWEQPLPMPSRKDQPADQDKEQDPDAPKRPQPSLLEMMVDYHNKQRPRSKHAIQYGQPDGTVTASPWGWLGNVGNSDRR